MKKNPLENLLDTYIKTARYYQLTPCKWSFLACKEENMKINNGLKTIKDIYKLLSPEERDEYLNLLKEISKDPSRIINLLRKIGKLTYEAPRVLLEIIQNLRYIREANILEKYIESIERLSNIPIGISGRDTRLEIYAIDIFNYGLNKIISNYASSQQLNKSVSYKEEVYRKIREYICNNSLINNIISFLEMDKIIEGYKYAERVATEIINSNR